MKPRTSTQIRREFIDFFVEKCGHVFVPSSPCIPHGDPTLLFTNAGMNQFKPLFLGTADPKTEFGRMKRAANSQKCIRAGGKHNDLDDVGHDTYHHTFFEMLGNWSFGDYFKKEAIAWAWELLTKVWGLNPQRLHATYFQGDPAEGLEPDTEARQLWEAILPADHVHPGNKKDNFWEMGDTGPCGPCSEIHIDMTASAIGGPLVNAGDASVMEIWNLVFIQFNSKWKPGGEENVKKFETMKPQVGWTGDDAEGRRVACMEAFGVADRAGVVAKNRTLDLLPAKHVDTGMGFERISAVVLGTETGQLGKVSNYDTEVFTPIFAAIQKVTGAPAYTGLLEGKGESNQPSVMKDVAYRVIGDHIRTLTFALTDGAVPSNEGRGYVLRRILRRAVRYGRQFLNTSKPFLCDLVPAVASAMGDAFPELRIGPEQTKPRDNTGYVANLIREEEASFIKTLDRGIALFEGTPEVQAVDIAREIKAILDVSDFAKNDFGIDFEKLGNVEQSLYGTVTSHQPILDDPEPLHNLIGITRTLIDGKNAESSDIRIRNYEYARDKLALAFATQVKISGRTAFELHSTYGFPIDLTQLMAQERGMSVDTAEYEQMMEESRQISRAGSSLDHLSRLLQIPREHLTETTDDSGKFVSTSVSATYRFATGWREEWQTNEYLSHPDSYPPQIGFVFDKTCFYGEQGGQVGDRGRIEFTGDRVYLVTDTRRSGNQIIHIVDWSGSPPTIRFGESARLIVDDGRRRPTEQNHTSTHVLNWALREVLGDNVQQKGSLVDPDKTRFDFSHHAAVTHEELARVEALVNERIAANLAVHAKEVPQKDALKIHGLRAVFGEKYPDIVRVVSIGPSVDELLADPGNEKWRAFSVEFCGGTHLKSTADAKRFRLIEESAVAKGIRRVVGITGDKAAAAEREAAALASRFTAAESGDAATLAATVADLSTALNAAEIPILDKAKLRERLAALQETVKKHHKQLTKSAAGDITARVDDLLAQAGKRGSTSIICADLGDATADQLRVACDSLRARAGSAAVFLAARDAGRVVLMAAMTTDVVTMGVKAGDAIKELSPVVGGKGGGRPDMAQGGGSDASKIGEAVTAADAWLSARLG